MDLYTKNLLLATRDLSPSLTSSDTILMASPGTDKRIRLLDFRICMRDGGGGGSELFFKDGMGGNKIIELLSSTSRITEYSFTFKPIGYPLGYGNDLVIGVVGANLAVGIYVTAFY